MCPQLPLLVISSPTTMPPLRQRLVPAAVVVRGPVREKVVDDETADGEEEDEQRPEELLQGRAGRLDHLDCGRLALDERMGGWRGRGGYGETYQTR